MNANSSTREHTRGLAEGFAENAAAQIDKAKADFAKLKADIESEVANAKIQDHQAGLTDSIQARLDETEGHFANLRNSGESTFQDARRKFDKSMESLRQSLKRAPSDSA